MIIDREAIYEDGVLRLKAPIDLPNLAEVHVTIAAADESNLTTLGARLRALREGMRADHQIGLDWSEIENEVASRRGGWREAG